jgi:hypothetical protein
LWQVTAALNTCHNLLTASLLDFVEDLKERGLIAPESKMIFKVDAAFVPFYPQNHKLRHVTEWDISFWKDFYGKTRPDAQKTQMQKGFIQLNF